MIEWECRKISIVYENLNEIELVEEAIKNGEGKLGRGGSLIVFTGEKTGRSPKDKHIVKEKNTEKKIWWDNNRSISNTYFDKLHADMLEHTEGKRCYSQALQASINTNEFLNIELDERQCLILELAQGRSIDKEQAAET